MEVGSNLSLVKSESRAMLAIRHAVRDQIALMPDASKTGVKVGVAVSGGADSMALAAALALEYKENPDLVRAVIIDHGLQEKSELVALATKERLEGLGYRSVEVIRVKVEITDGLESSARRARYEALESFAVKENLSAILLGHTKNDQAETVLLGLARGSGTRSLSGMAPVKGIFRRPLLGIERSTTEEACRDLGIEFWSEPHNQDPQFLRVRVRKMLPDLESQIGPGVVDALARSSDLLRDDADALDGYAHGFFESIDPTDIEIEALARLPRAVRTRVLRLAIYALGAPQGSLTADHISPIEALVSDWHGQGATSLPGGVKVERKSGRLSLSRRG